VPYLQQSLRDRLFRRGSPAREAIEKAEVSHSDFRRNALGILERVGHDLERHG
jgi:hypothetical protein